MQFIDGDHTFNMVKKDFYSWGNKIEPDGYIVFHDAVLEGITTVQNQYLING